MARKLAATCTYREFWYGHRTTERMPKTYENFTSYPEHDHQIHRDSYDGKIKNVTAYIHSGVNIYQPTKFSLTTPLFLAISGQNILIIDQFLNIYRRDLDFIAEYFRSKNVIGKFWLKFPILIGYGLEELRLVNDLYMEYTKYETTNVVPAVNKSVIILLKENNLTQSDVFHLAPQTPNGKSILLKILQIILHNGHLHLNGYNSIGDSIAKVATINGLFDVFQKLIDLGCDYDVNDIARLAMKSGRIEFVDQMIRKYNIDINVLVDHENDFFNLIGSGEWQMFEWIVNKLIILNGFREHAQLFWKNILNMGSDRYYGGTLYHFAIICDQIDFVEKYLEYLPNLKLPNRDGDYPIHQAFHSERYKAIVLRMIELDNELLEIESSNKKNILHLMVERNWSNVLESISQKYPKTKYLFFSSAETAAASLNQAIFNNYTDGVKFIIELCKDQINYDDLYKYLNSAVVGNAYEIIQYILSIETFDLFQPTKDGAYPLISALWNRNSEIYLVLLQHSPHTKQNLHGIKDVENNSLLWYTIWSSEHFHTIEQYKQFNLFFDELLLAGLKYDNIGCSSGQNFIHQCAIMGNDAIMKSLVTCGLSIELWDADGYLPIHYAPNLATFKLLNEKSYGTLINVKTRKAGNTLLHLLMVRGNQTDSRCSLLEYMLQNGGDVNALNNLNQTPLHLVKSDAWARMLLQYGANINALDSDGNTPVHAAFNSLHYKVVKVLLEEDINLNVTNNTGFNYLAGFLKQDYNVQQKFNEIFPNIMRTDNTKFQNLISTHCNSSDQEGMPLLISAMYSSDLLCEKLLANGSIDVNGRDKISHRAAIHATAMYKKFDIINRLIRKGANINDRDAIGNTPLHYTCQFYHEHAIDVIKYGADVNAINNNSETPLHYVALADLHGNTICQLLLSGASLTVKNSDGKMPYDLLRDDLKKIFQFIL